MARVILVCCVVVILSGTHSLNAQDSSVPLQPIQIDGAVSRVYKSVNGSELRLHIFNPVNRASAAPAPAIVFFFGGGWTNGTVNQFVPQSKHLAERGMVAIVADYRVFGRHRTSAFEAIADAKSAIRWLRIHAAELGVDANRIAAGGGSAGGHVALSAAVLDQFDETDEDRRVSSKPDALVLFNPVVDTSPGAGAALGPLSETLKARFLDRGGDGSPLSHIGSSVPPTIIVYGKADATVPYSDVDRFCSQVRSRGSVCQLVGYEGATHGFFNPDREEGKWYRETLLAADRFLTEIGYLRRPVPVHVP